MTRTPSLFSSLRRWLRQFASLPEPAEFDYPFARSDIAMLQRVEEGPAQLDEQTWDEVLLDDYHAQLAAQTSILGQQRLHQRLASGIAGAASRARIAALLAAPAQQAALEQAMRPLRTADMEVAAAVRRAAAGTAVVEPLAAAAQPGAAGVAAGRMAGRAAGMGRRRARRLAGADGLADALS